MNLNKAPAPFRFTVQERSLPVPSGSPSHTIDWLPDYFGYSWVAYASSSSLVITTIPSPTRKDEADLGLCQVIDAPHDAPAHITCVRWAPTPLGPLAASCGHLLWIYTPLFSNPHDEDSSSDFPQGWVLSDKLEHTFEVWSFAWTELGDGLLSVGTEVNMWRHDESGWNRLWTSHVTHPQSFAAATLSAKGLAATAEGNFSVEDSKGQVDEFDRSVTKGKATVWWWEDSLGLLESELVHPQEVLFLQWRPSKGPFTLQEAFRPVLMTACKDGAVRLWLEIDSGRARLDKALGKDVSVKHLKPAYFVSAVIEAEQCLHGMLGVDVFVSWPLECRPGDSPGVLARSSYGTNTISKRQSTGSCECLIGIGPEGSICIWSLFCLDDVYPPRCPRVFLWKQASGVLSTPAASAGSKKRQVLIKVISQRSGNRQADPPSILDLFYTSQPTLLQWSRVWPPVSALCGDFSKETVISEAIGSSIVPGKAKKDAWGMVTECFISNGHSRDIICIAVHPVTFTGLVATLDSQGDIFLWRSSPCLKRSLSLCVSVWKYLSQLAVSLVSETLTWLPAVFFEGQTVLLLAHAGFVDCYLVSEKSNTTSSGSSLEVKLLSRVDLCVDSPDQGLNAIWALPTDSQNKDFLIVGLSQARGEVVSCNLEIIVEEANCYASDQVLPDQVKKQTNFTVIMSSSIWLETFESVSCVAIAPIFFLPFLQTLANSFMFEPLPFSRPYEIVTGSRDGMIRLWKKGAQYISGNFEVDTRDDVWQCVGSVKVSLGPVTMIAVGCSGLKIAMWCPAPLEMYGEGILIWDIESLTESVTFNLRGRISLAGCPTSMQWLDLGNGASLLGLLTQSEVQVYVELRAFNKSQNSFTDRQNLGQQTSVEFSQFVLASVVLFSSTSCFSWGPKGSLLVPFKEHLLVYGPWILPDNTAKHTNQVDLRRLLESQWDQAWSLLKAGEVLSSPLPKHHPVAMLHNLYTGNHQRARVCLLYLQQNLSGLSASIEGKAPCGLLQMYSPIELLEISQMEANTVQKTRIKQETSLSWSTGLDRDFEDYAASFSNMSLAGEDVDRVAALQENEASTVLNVQKLELCLGKFLDVLGLAEDQRMQLLTVADVLVKMGTEAKASEYASLDPSGQRFWLAVQLSYSNHFRKSGKNLCIEDLYLETKAMAWALQSDCKDTLLDVCLGNELSWPAMRALGVGFWLTDTSQLRTRMEKLARAQYLMEKNPKHCALLYLALQRKNVLMGLFKLSKDEKDRVLYEFLSRDFLVERNQAAALKNAYVLLGKHQHDLAAAFFLLGGDLSSAASACAKNLGDLQLAFVVCRLIEGINGPTEQRLIKDYALLKAQKEGDYWFASLLQWLLGEHFQAIEELTGRLTISETRMGSEHPEKESSFCVVSSDGIRGAFVDPEVGLFCIHMASKPIVQSCLSVASAVAVCKWLTLKTSTALERLGLPLEALEYLSSAKDGFWSNLQSKNKNVLVAAVNSFTAFKTRLALHYQSQLVQAHPCWWFGQRTVFSCLRSSSVAVSSADSRKRPLFEMAADASNKLLQSLNILENRFGIDTKYIAAELARLAHGQNMLYLQCVFTRGTTDEAQSSKDLFSVPCLKFLDCCLKISGEELFKVIDPLGICDMQRSIPTAGSCGHSKGGKCLPLAASETLLLAIDLWLFLGQHGENMEGNVEVALLILVLYSAAAWKKCDWNAIGLVTRLIKSPATALCMPLSDMEAAFKILLENSELFPSRAVYKVIPQVVSGLGQLTEFEFWHVLGLAFWEAFLGWAKQQLKIKSSQSSEQGSSTKLVHFTSQRDATHQDLLKAPAFVASFFRRQLVFYFNSSVKETPLSHWLLSNHNVTGNPPSISLGQTSSVTAVPDWKDDNRKAMLPALTTHTSHSPHAIARARSPPINSPIEEVVKELLVPSSIRSTLELGGARLNTDEREGVLGVGTTEKPLGFVMPNSNCEIDGKSTALERKNISIQFKNGVEVFHSNGDLLEAICVNSCCPEQVVVASSRKGLLYFDINTGKNFSTTESNLWIQAEWPQNGWANSESTPIPTYVSPGVGLRSKEGPSLGLGGANVGLGMLTNVGKESSFKGAGVGIPGYGGMGALGLGWEEWEDFDGVIDPLATMENVNTQAMDSHPLRPLFLVGSRNTHVYLWEFGKSSATATYGILPAANIPPPYALASVSSVKFDHSGHRFATSAIDGTVCTWQLEVGGRSNVRPTDSCLCFDRHASDVAFVGGSGGIIAASGASQNNLNLVFWDTLAPSTTSQASIFCHEGGARCLEMFDHDVGGGSISSLIVTCGKGGDIAVHDFRYIATGKSKRTKYVKKEHAASHDDQSSRKQQDGELNVNGSVWYIAKAHSGSISCVSAVPGTSLFFTGSKDGDVKLWDANKCELVNHWHRVHDKHMFLQHNARGFGATLQQDLRGFGGVFQAAVTDIQPVSLGFLTCGGDGFLRFFRRQYS
eukprot:c23571_g1_i1 orf=63-7415(+)